MTRRLLIIDNYDSFTWNLYEYCGRQGAGEMEVLRNDEVDVDDIPRLGIDHIIISPGPGDPSQDAWFGNCRAILARYHRELPILGVCLGHQGIGHFFGWRIRRARRIMHGKQSQVRVLKPHPLFAGVPDSFRVMRYHSLAIEPAGPGTSPIEVMAMSEDGDDDVMAIRHRELDVYGIQFHPESIGTDFGQRILANFLSLGT